MRALRLFLLAIIYLAFVSLGLPDSVLGLAWPAMRTGFGLPLEAVGLITLVLTACSAFSGFMSGRVLARFGTGPVTFASALLTGSALLGISFAPAFPVVVLLAFPLGLGAGSVDSGLNHFVAEHYSSRHMNWLHACWGIGATVGPMIMASALAGTWGWTGGYRLIGGLQLGLAAVLLLTLGLWKHRPPAHHERAEAAEAAPKAFPRWAVWLAPALFFMYSAVETGTGLWAASLLIEGRGFDPAVAGAAVTLFFGSVMGGRILVGFVSDRLGNRRLVKGGLLVALAGIALVAIPGPGFLPFAGLALIGLGCAPIYPALMHEAPRRFDRDTARRVIGRQVAFAYVGGALLPGALGLLAGHLSLEAVFPAIAAAAALMLAMAVTLDRAT